MIGLNTTIREVFELMRKTDAACLRITVDDDAKKPMCGFVFTDGTEATQWILGAAAAAQEEWENLPTPGAGVDNAREVRP